MPGCGRHRIQEEGECDETQKDQIWRKRIPLDAVIFSIAIGNVDAHARNYSVLLHSGRPGLASRYDLMSGLAWTEITERHAQDVGGQRRADTFLPGTGDGWRRPPDRPPPPRSGAHLLSRLLKICGASQGRIQLETARSGYGLQEETLCLTHTPSVRRIACHSPTWFSFQKLSGTPASI